MLIPTRGASVVIAADTCVSSPGDACSTARKIYRFGSALIAGAGTVGDLQASADLWVSKGGSLGALARGFRDRERPWDVEWLYCGPEGAAYVDAAGGISRGRFGYDAAGSGRWYALGFLRARIGDRAPSQARAVAVARECLTAVAECDPGVRAPFDVEIWRPR